MAHIRLDPPIPVETPWGLALAHFLVDRGIEFDNEWICFHRDGVIWSWMNYDVRASKNITMGREIILPIERKVPMPTAKQKAAFERSSADKSKDKREAAKRGMSVKKFEGSPADERMDRAAMKKMASKKRK